MSDFIERAGRLSPRRLLLLAAELQSQLEAGRSAGMTERSPIAVIGMSCRFPGGVESPQAFWDLLVEGKDAITEIPADRWDARSYYDPDPNASGKIATRWGGFVKDIDRFDPGFFGITPREAQTMDPQQRMALEGAWEAFEDAGISVDEIAGAPTGVFIGACNSDYFQLLGEAGDSYSDMYLSTGNAHSVISGRISYLFNLQGPSLTVDTACSSSLAAVYLAVQSLRSGACRMALAGGVNAILSPETTKALSRAQMLASDGRCKTFDAAADGFVRSEGCGMLLLKKLEDALTDGDRIMAVIHGAAINQDGRSNGLTAPNGPSQAAVIQAALANAGVNSSLVSYVETHGTGTSLGDPIEVQALGAALQAGQAKRRPVWIGSVKTNLGHLESAAGVAGLIKLVLSLQHRQIPANLHFQHPNPLIPWARLPFRVPTTLTPWEAVEGRWIGGISSFGFSGTNIHLIVEAAPGAEAANQEQRSEAGLPQILCISAHNKPALTELTWRTYNNLDSTSPEYFADYCVTASRGRASLTHRFALLARSPQEAREKLAALGGGQAPDGSFQGAAASGRQSQAVFLFTGHGSQTVNMGRELRQTSPIFRQALERTAKLFDPYLPAPLLDILYPPGTDAPAPLETKMLLSQAALFTLQVALAEQWRAWGVIPAAVLGHSLGEYAAAWLSGVISLEDAVKLVAARGRLFDSIPTSGLMAAVFAPEVQVLPYLASFGGRVEIAGVNSPQETVISGASEAVEAAIEMLHRQGIRSHRLAVPQAAHSSAVEPFLGAFGDIARSVHFSEPVIPLVSSSLGRLVHPGEATVPEYWQMQLRRPVRFSDGMAALADLKPTSFVEIGPAPVLLALGQRCVSLDGVQWLPSLRPGKTDSAQMLSSLAALWVSGGSIRWNGWDPQADHARASLPTYPFQRERCWIQIEKKEQPDQPGGRAGAYPLPVRRIVSPALEKAVFECSFGADSLKFLADHRIFGLQLLPSPAYLEMALAAADSITPGLHVIENFTIFAGLSIPEAGERIVQLILEPEISARAGFTFYSQDPASGKWTRNAAGTLLVGRHQEVARSLFNAAPVRQRCTEHISGTEYYQSIEKLGLEFGPMFQGLADIWRRDGEALGEMRLPEALNAELEHYHFHPAFLDACFHLVGAPLPPGELTSAYLLTSIDRLCVLQKPGPRLFNHTVLSPISSQNGRAFTGDIHLYNEDGSLVAEILGLQFRLASREAVLRQARQLPADWFYRVEWQPRPRATYEISDFPSRWLLFADSGGVGASLAAALAQNGRQATLVYPGAQFSRSEAGITIAPDQPEDYQRVLALDELTPCEGIVYAWGLEPKPADEAAGSAAARACSGLVSILQVIGAKNESGKGPVVWAVTRGAQAVGAEAAPLALEQASLWGLGRVASLEYPQRWGGLMDLDPGWDATQCAQAMLPELLAPGGEDALAWRSGQRLAARLVRADAPGFRTPTIRAEAAYLVTGGMGGLGLRVARWLVENGARTLVLAGRSPLPEREGWQAETLDAETRQRVDEIQALEAVGAVIHPLSLDVTDSHAVAQLVARFGKDLPQLRGVFHAAAHLALCPIPQLDQRALQEVVRPKADGAWALHESTLGMELDFFVLFSSTTALWGVQEMGAYAAANSYLDALAQERRRVGLPATSINWGTWDVMRLASAMSQANYLRFGLIPMPAELALDCLGSLAHPDGPAQIAVANIDWERLRPAYEASQKKPFFEGLEPLAAPRPAARPAAAPAGPADLVERLQGLEEDERKSALLTWVCEAIAGISGMVSLDQVDPHQGLFEIGLDSLMSVELKGRLEQGVHRKLPSTLTFNYPTAADLAVYLYSLLFPDTSAALTAKTTAPDEVQEKSQKTQSNLDELSEEELERILQDRLKKMP